MLFRSNYLALDVHGAEFEILKTIDFGRLRVDVLTVECYDRNKTVKTQKRDRIAEIFDKTRLYEKIVTDKEGDLFIRRRDL